MRKNLLIVSAESEGCVPKGNGKCLTHVQCYYVNLHGDAMSMDTASLQGCLMQKISGWFGPVDQHLDSYQYDSGSDLNMDDHCVVPIENVG